tara:strand:- start:132 stop:308 length:177 start_codon:yes stop_codon:yes gene_type:complete
MTEVVSVEDFHSKKIDWYVQMWQYGRHTDAVFIKNMVHLGFDQDMIEQTLEDYHEEDT